MTVTSGEAGESWAPPLRRFLLRLWRLSMARWPWSKPDVTDEAVKREIARKQEDLRRRLEERLGRDIQYEIEAIREH